jgi:iron complex transport system ATP-binding protein
VAVARLHPATRAWTEILHDLDWEVDPGERWVLLGPNGAGKSTLLTLVAAAGFPTKGTVEVLGEQLGRSHMPTLRERIGVVGTRIAEEVAFWPALDVLDVILSGATGTIVLRYDRLGEAERERAALLAARLGIERLLDRPFSGCSDGERQRVLLARALMPDPPLLVLDEPTAGLDLPGREELLASLDRLAVDEPSLTTVTVLHHLEDVPESTTHALLLRDGAPVAAGPAADVLRDGPVSAAFGLDVEVLRDGGRYRARRARR